MLQGVTKNALVRKSRDRFKNRDDPVDSALVCLPHWYFKRERIKIFCWPDVAWPKSVAPSLWSRRSSIDMSVQCRRFSVAIHTQSIQKSNFLQGIQPVSHSHAWKFHSALQRTRWNSEMDLAFTAPAVTARVRIFRRKASELHRIPNF